MVLSGGNRLAHYAIVEKIGSGGMGDVYLAEDTKLDRKIALKVLPPHLAESEERRARFEREAKALAALNHPGVVQVYSVEESDGVHFITMELVEGKRLTELIPRGGMKLDRFFEIAIPLADAVAVAHKRGVIHRDLKPDNVMVTDEGAVKVLDFGLARHEAPVRVDGDSESPTALKTQEGVLAGTLHYMSPEQAEGKSVDERSDNFSLGIVFYEMLTGGQPFHGDTPAAVLSSILKEEPASLRDARPDTPREISRLVHRCLAKERRKRFQSALDVHNELEDLRRDLASGELAEMIIQTPTPTVKWLGVAGASLFLAIAGLFYISRDRSATRPMFSAPVQLTSMEGMEEAPVWSPDGNQLAFAADGDIWVVHLGGGPPVNRTAGSEDSFARPSWSPDGSRIAFGSVSGGGSATYVMPALGGTPRRVLSFEGSAYRAAPQWSADAGELAVYDQHRPRVLIVTLPGLETREIDLAGRLCNDMSWSPDGRFFACVAATNISNPVSQLWIQPVTRGDGIELSDRKSAVWSPSWSSDGAHLYFVSDRGGNLDLWRQRIGDSGRPEGEPEPLTVGVGMRYAALSRDGSKLAYSQSRQLGKVWRVPILSERAATWDDAEQITFDEAFVNHIALSPDGKRLVVASDRAGNMDLWELPAEGGELIQLTVDPAVDQFPALSPDGGEILMQSYRGSDGDADIFVMPREGGPARVLVPHVGHEGQTSWSPDGSEIAFISERSGNYDLWVMPAAGGEPRQLTTHPAVDQFLQWSPDSQWFAFQSYRDGGRIWRVAASGGEPEVLTESLGHLFRWSPDGSHLYFVSFENGTSSIRSLSIDDRLERPATDLKGRPGYVWYYALATDGEYLYFVWREDVGDIWVMDAVQE